MSMNIEYRDYQEDDFGVFCDMVFRLYREDPEGQPIDAEKINLTICESLDFPEKLRVVMICADGAIIGYGILVFYWSNEYGGDILHIDELYIKEDYRNQGIASGFIKLLMSSSNIAAIEVEATPSNDEAANFYKGLGFEASPNDHLILQLP